MAHAANCVSATSRTSSIFPKQFASDALWRNDGGFRVSPWLFTLALRWGLKASPACARSCEDGKTRDGPQDRRLFGSVAMRSMTVHDEHRGGEDRWRSRLQIIAEWLMTDSNERGAEGLLDGRNRRVNPRSSMSATPGDVRMIESGRSRRSTV